MTEYSPAALDDLEVATWLGEDGVPVVQIDTQGEGRFRINVNDGPIWDQSPEEAVPDLAARVRDAIDAHHIAASFFTGPDLEALVCVCTDGHGSGEFATYEDFLAHQAQAVTAALRPTADSTKEATRA